MTALTVRRPGDCPPTRWKNGGGETRDIAIAPAGATLENFDWRLSMATVAAGGPFSTFAGVDRTLLVVDGAGLEIQIDGQPARRLDAASEPLSFPGEAATRATLLAGVVTDFNVMTRRNRYRHRVERVDLRAGHTREVAPDIRAVFCQAGTVSVSIVMPPTAPAAVVERLEAADTALRLTSDGHGLRVRAETAARLCLVSIRLAGESAQE